jgi:hypothetical protein
MQLLQWFEPNFLCAGRAGNWVSPAGNHFATAEKFLNATGITQTSEFHQVAE